MKIRKLYKVSALWDWIKKNLPLSFETLETQRGYGFIECEIFIQGQKPNWLARNLLFQDRAIARVQANELTLYDPAYFSDFEDLLEKFEKKTGERAELHFWNS